MRIVDSQQDASLARQPWYRKGKGEAEAVLARRPLLGIPFLFVKSARARREARDDWQRLVLRTVARLTHEGGW